MLAGWGPLALQVGQHGPARRRPAGPTAPARQSPSWLDAEHGGRRPPSTRAAFSVQTSGRKRPVASAKPGD